VPKLREILGTNPYDDPDSQFVLNFLSPTLQRPPAGLVTLAPSAWPRQFRKTESGTNLSTQEG
jgi:hypothetical protein